MNAATMPMPPDQQPPPLMGPQMPPDQSLQPPPGAPMPNLAGPMPNTAGLPSPPQPTYAGTYKGPFPVPPPMNIPAPTGGPPQGPAPMAAQPQQRGLTPHQARTSDIIGGLQGFQNAMQRADAAKQEQLYQRGVAVIQQINQTGQQPDPVQARLAQEELVKANLAPLRAVGVPGLPADPDQAKPGILRKIIMAIAGVQSHDQGGGSSAPAGDMSQMPQQTPAMAAQAIQIQDAQKIAQATAAIDPKLRAGIAAGTVASPASLQVAGVKHDAEMDKVHAQMDAHLRPLGFKLDDDGKPVPLEADETSIAQKDKSAYNKLREDYITAQKELDEAKTEVEQAKNDPDSPMSKIAQGKLQIAQQNVALRGQQIKLAQQVFNAGYLGTGPDGQPLPGTALTPEGQSIGPRVQRTQQNQLTAQSRAMSETAQTLLPHIADIRQQIDALDAQGKLGPLAGRYEDFMAGNVGKSDPAYEKLRVEMGLLTTGMMRAHVGARGGTQLLDHFKSLVNAGKMDAPTLDAGLEGMESFLQGYANMGKTPTAGGNPAAPPTSPKPQPAPQKPPKAAVAPGTVNMRGPDGKVWNVTTDKKKAMQDNGYVEVKP